LKDVLDALSKLTNRQVDLFGYPKQDEAPGKSLIDTRIKLDFDNAPLADILLSICKQAGLVYGLVKCAGGPGSLGAPIWFRPGDMSIDSAATAVLDDYVLRTGGATVTRERMSSSGWGMPIERRPLREQMEMFVEVIPRSPDAALCLLGLDYQVKVFPDAGAALTGIPRFPYDQDERDPSGRSLAQSGVIRFEAPDPRATMLTRLEGGLSVLQSIKATEVRVTADSEGQTFSGEDIVVTVRSWKSQFRLTIDMDVNCPPLKSAVANVRPIAWVAAVLVDHEGRRVYPFPPHQGGPIAYWSDEQTKVSLMFPTTWYTTTGRQSRGTESPYVPEALLLTFYRSPGDRKTVPFVISNIPLP
jgi:hypothetical protein